MRIRRDDGLYRLFMQAAACYPELTEGAFYKIIDQAITRAPKLRNNPTMFEVGAWADDVLKFVLAELKKKYPVTGSREQHRFLQGLVDRLRVPVFWDRHRGNLRIRG